MFHAMDHSSLGSDSSGTKDFNFRHGVLMVLTRSNLHSSQGMTPYGIYL